MPKRKARYVVEIRDATGASLFLTTADWTDSELWRRLCGYWGTSLQSLNPKHETLLAAVRRFAQEGQGKRTWQAEAKL